MEFKAKPWPRDDFTSVGMRDVRSFEDFLKLDIFRLTP